MKKLDSDTEKSSLYDSLEKMSTEEILTNINQEDAKITAVVASQIPMIRNLVDGIVDTIAAGGRLFYIGAGTSGRLGILDASECPPTFGVDENVVIGIIAGGDIAIRRPVENAEDDTTQAWQDLQAYGITAQDVVIGIAASGNTPYVVGGVKKAKEMGLLTGAIFCNSKAKLKTMVDFPIELVVGPEFLTGSTRMKAGTSQKLALNMITTTLMIRLGKVKGNKMVDMQLTNKKLVTRGITMITETLGIDVTEAQELLLKYGSVRKVLNYFNR